MYVWMGKNFTKLCLFAILRPKSYLNLIPFKLFFCIFNSLYDELLDVFAFDVFRRSEILLLKVIFGESHQQATVEHLQTLTIDDCSCVWSVVFHESGHLLVLTNSEHAPASAFSFDEVNKQV